MEGQLRLDTRPDDELRVCQIGYEDVLPFVLNIHYARRVPQIVYAFGLYKGINLIGVATYGIPASPGLCSGLAGLGNRQNVIELNRLVILPEYNGQNYASYLVSHSLKMLPSGTFVVSYADCGWGHVGYVYQATNWLYTGKTRKRMDFASQYGHPRHYIKGETKKVERSEKYRYVYLCGSKNQRRKMAKELRYPVIDKYPKGNSIHYDVNNPKQPEEGICEK